LTTLKHRFTAALDAQNLNAKLREHITEYLVHFTERTLNDIHHFGCRDPLALMEAPRNPFVLQASIDHRTTAMNNHDALAFLLKKNNRLRQISGGFHI
jgi:hypothetical protein